MWKTLSLCWQIYELEKLLYLRYERPTFLRLKMNIYVYTKLQNSTVVSPCLQRSIILQNMTLGIEISQKKVCCILGARVTSTRSWTILYLSILNVSIRFENVQNLCVTKMPEPLDRLRHICSLQLFKVKPNCTCETAKNICRNVKNIEQRSLRFAVPLFILSQCLILQNILYWL